MQESNAQGRSEIQTDWFPQPLLSGVPLFDDNCVRFLQDHFPTFTLGSTGALEPQCECGDIRCIFGHRRCGWLDFCGDVTVIRAILISVINPEINRQRREIIPVIPVALLSSLSYIDSLSVSEIIDSLWWFLWEAHYSFIPMINSPSLNLFHDFLVLTPDRAILHKRLTLRNLLVVIRTSTANLTNRRNRRICCAISKNLAIRIIRDWVGDLLVDCRSWLGQRKLQRDYDLMFGGVP